MFSCLELLQTSTVLVIFGDLHPSNSELLCVNAVPVTCDPVRIYCRKCLLLSSMSTLAFNVDHVIILCVRVPGSVRSVYSRQEIFLS